jgi:hypothetical protein
MGNLMLRPLHSGVSRTTSIGTARLLAVRSRPRAVASPSVSQLRTWMALWWRGLASIVEDENHKRRAMEVYVNRFTPGRVGANRDATEKELRATKLLSMDIEDASAKIRVGPPGDDEEDYSLPVWAGVINFKTIVADIVPDPRNLSGVHVPAGLHPYANGRQLDEVLSEICDAGTSSSLDAEH